MTKRRVDHLRGDLTEGGRGTSEGRVVRGVPFNTSGHAASAVDETGTAVSRKDRRRSTRTVWLDH